MDIVVMGASGGVGRSAVDAALKDGHTVRAASRSGAAVAPPATAVTVDVRDFEAVARAIDGMDAVLWCVGVTPTSGPDVGRIGLTNLVRAAGSGGTLRVVSVSGAGVTLPGDDKGFGARLVSSLTRRLAHDLVTDKEAEHAVLAASDLDWTEVRPPRLSTAPATGSWTLTERAPGLTARPVPRADVATAMLSLAVDDDMVHRSPFIVSG
jgi:uncharacterized protein YbjT (DUF2867 family)